MPETGWPAEPDCHGLGLEFDCLGFEDSGLRALGFRVVLRFRLAVYGAWRLALG